MRLAIAMALVVVGLCWVANTASAATVLVEAEDSDQVTRTGSWEPSYGSGGVVHGDSIVTSAFAGDMLTFEFTGVALVVGYTKGPNHGVFAVSIDGGSAVVVDTYAAGTWSFQNRTLIASDLGYGPHSVSLVHLWSEWHWPLYSSMHPPYVGIDFFEYDTGVIPVVIDVKPGSESNPVNLKSKGRLPVAVLSTDDFDAADVDDATVQIGGVAPVKATLEDVDGDGSEDLLLHFDTQELVGAGVLGSSSTSLTLTGETLGGEGIEGSDAVQIVR